MKQFSHIPVMLEECMQALDLKSDGIYFDGTIGAAGHSYEILKRTSPHGKLIATDLDDEAIAAATEKLKEFKNRFLIFKSNYKNYEQVLNEAQVQSLDGVLLDFGVSSHQLDDGGRGFSYMQPSAPLDMRMDRSQSLTAEYIVNNYAQAELAKILRDYGEERFAPQIAANIVKARKSGAITKSGELTDIIESSIPAKFRQNGPPARKSFQAIRIAVNGELTGLYECVLGLTRKLKKGGRIAIITFHSLEDRIVKQAFKMLECDCICDKSLPVCVCGKRQEIDILTKKPIVASEQEMATNPRSRSAKLRVARKII